MDFLAGLRDVREHLSDDPRSDGQIVTELRSRLADLEAGRDAGMSFEEVFGAQA